MEVGIEPEEAALPVGERDGRMVIEKDGGRKEEREEGREEGRESGK